MPLKGILPTLDGLDEATKALYKKREDGRYVLDVEDLVEKDKLDEFRTNNRELKSKVDSLLAEVEKYKGIDPAKAKEALSKLQQIQEEKLISEGKIEELLTQRTERMKAEFAEQLAAKEKLIGDLTSKNKEIATEKDQYIIFSELAREIDNPDLGFQSGVADLLKPQVLKEFAIRDGKVVAVKSDGSLLFGKDGNPKTLKEFLGEVAKDKPFLVRASNGSGANNNNANQRGGGAGIVLTPEQLADPAQYRAAKAEAEKRGVPLQTA